MKPELLSPAGTLRNMRFAYAYGADAVYAGQPRYISNHSSGKMGYSLAEAAAEAGAGVVLISGPVNLATPERVSRVDVTDARDMYNAVMQHAPQCDIFIGCAAVADYRPELCAETKIKKDPDSPEQTLTISLVRNPDIIAAVGALDERPYVVGFAAETGNVIDYATNKRRRKNMDLIVANDVSDTSIGFNSDENAVTLISEEYEETLSKSSKKLLARQLIDMIARSSSEKPHYDSSRIP